MDKRLLIAVALSIVFLWVWAALMPKFFPELARPAKPAAEQEIASTTDDPSPASTTSETPPGRETPAMPGPAAAAEPGSRTAALPAVTADSERVVVVDNPRYVARLTNRGAQLVSFRLKNYRTDDGDLVDLVAARPEGADHPFFLLSGDRAFNDKANRSLYQVVDSEERGGRTVEFRFSDGAGLTITKRFVFAGDYPFDVSVTTSGAPPFRMVIGPGIAMTETVQQQGLVTSGNGIVKVDDSFDVIQRKGAPAMKVIGGKPAFFGLESNYFLTVLKPRQSGEAIFRAAPLAKDEQHPQLFASLNAVNGVVEATAFFLPKDAAVLDQYGLADALHWGIFGFIAHVLLKGLLWIYNYTHNYGWAIIVLTVLIKIILYPLQHKSIVSMKKMQQLQPKVNALRDKYKKAKTDPEQRQKMNVEMMKLYQQEGVNPMSGCFPILLQLPILWAFYTLLSHAIELRGAEFMLWIQDLSQKDPYYITPILMTVTMVIQQRITPTTIDPVQRKIFMMMPLVFGFIFKDFPSGLVLYWLVQNVLGIAQQMAMNYWWKEHPIEAKEAKA